MDEIRLDVTIGGDDVTLTEANTTVFTFRDAKHMDHVFVQREKGSTYLFSVPEFVRKLIDMDFPLQSSRWPREGDFEAFEMYIDHISGQIAGDLDHELDELQGGE